MRLKNRLLVTFGVAFLLLTFLVPNVLADGDRCSDPRNLTFNCDFNTFTDYSSADSRRVVADGWYFWIEEGNPAFEHGEDSPVPPSQQIWSDGGNFRVGIYQTVRNLTPGATYIAGVGWVPYTAPDGSIMRQVGIDPYGGTNPLSTDVVWGPEDWRFSRFTNLEVRAVAQNPTITIFIRIYNPASHGADIVFIDGANLLLDPNVPVIPVGGQSIPTSTPVPPTATALPPTATIGTPIATATEEAPAATAVPASPTTAPATSTFAPTPTRVPPSATPNPPTVTPRAPTEIAEPTATRASRVPPTNTAGTHRPSTPAVPPTKSAVDESAMALQAATVTVETSPHTLQSNATPQGESAESATASEVIAPAIEVVEPTAPGSGESPLVGPAAVLAVMGIAGLGGGWYLYRRRN